MQGKRAFPGWPVGPAALRKFEEWNESMEVVEYPVDGSLDLHMFSPRDVPSVVEEYLEE